MTDHLGKGGPTYFYRVEITPVRPRLSLSIPKVALFSQERQTIPVPRGNRYAALISAARADFGGELDGRRRGLACGHHAFRANIWRRISTSCPCSSRQLRRRRSPVSLRISLARHADPPQKIQGGFEQMLELVTGPPGQSVYWRHEVDRAAVAVTEEVPFKIQIVEPKVPLVQNGSMNLKVVAERKAGYKAPITVQMLFNPPGVGSASAATIPEGQNETVIPMNAASNAQVHKWKIVVIGAATVGNGPVWVASQLATLEIAPPYVNLAMERAAVGARKEHRTVLQGAAADAFFRLRPVQLLGLPNKVTAADANINKDTKEFAFKVNVDKTSPAGTHRNIFCQLVIMQNGEPVVHNLGGTELRIDVPLPPKASEPAKRCAPQQSRQRPHPPPSA